MTPRSCLNTTIFFCIISSLCHGASSITFKSATNGNVTLQPGVEGQIDEILWKHKGNKMVEWDKTATAPTEYLTFKGRTKLDLKTGDVTIVKLTKNDSGHYEAEVAIQGRLTIRSQRVDVIDPVTRAKVTCKRSNATMATLLCEAEGDFLSYSWSGPGLQTEMRGQTGPQITKEKDSVYTCVVNNPVSISTMVYHSNDCFDSHAGNLPLIIGVAFSAVIGVAALAAGFGYYCYKKSTGQKDAGNGNKPEARVKEGGEPLLPSDEQGKRDEEKAAKVPSGTPKQSGHTDSTSNGEQSSGHINTGGEYRQNEKKTNPAAEEQIQSLPLRSESPESTTHGGQEEDTDDTGSAGVPQTSDDNPIGNKAMSSAANANMTFSAKNDINNTRSSSIKMNAKQFGLKSSDCVTNPQSPNQPGYTDALSEASQPSSPMNTKGESGSSTEQSNVMNKVKVFEELKKKCEPKLTKVDPYSSCPTQHRTDYKKYH